MKEAQETARALAIPPRPVKPGGLRRCGDDRSARHLHFGGSGCAEPADDEPWGRMLTVEEQGRAPDHARPKPAPLSGAPAPADRLYIAWKAECFRSFQTAHLLRCALFLIRPDAPGGGLGVVVRYVLSAVETGRILLRHRPRLVCVLNQPLPLAVMAAAYGKLCGARVVLDCHSRPYQPNAGHLYRWCYQKLSRFVDLNINHNESDSAVVRSWFGKSAVLESIPAALPVDTPPAEEGGGGYVFCACSFAWDEPIDVVLDAARRLPEVEFRVSGNFRKFRGDLTNLPANLRLLGFIETADYYRQLVAADALVTLSRRNWIMQMAAEEALTAGVPVVTNHSPVLESVLGEGAVFVDLTGEALAAGISRALADAGALRRGITIARERQNAKVEATATAAGLI